MHKKQALKEETCRRSAIVALGAGERTRAWVGRLLPARPVTSGGLHAVVVFCIIRQCGTKSMGAVGGGGGGVGGDKQDLYRLGRRSVVTLLLRFGSRGRGGIQPRLEPAALWFRAILVVAVVGRHRPPATEALSRPARPPARLTARPTARPPARPPTRRFLLHRA